MSPFCDAGSCYNKMNTVSTATGTDAPSRIIPGVQCEAGDAGRYRELVCRPHGSAGLSRAVIGGAGGVHSGICVSLTRVQVWWFIKYKKTKSEVNPPSERLTGGKILRPEITPSVRVRVHVRVRTTAQRLLLLLLLRAGGEALQPRRTPQQLRGSQTTGEHRKRWRKVGMLTGIPGITDSVTPGETTQPLPVSAFKVKHGLSYGISQLPGAAYCFKMI